MKMPRAVGFLLASGLILLASHDCAVSGARPVKRFHIVPAANNTDDGENRVHSDLEGEECQCGIANPKTSRTRKRQPNKVKRAVWHS